MLPGCITCLWLTQPNCISKKLCSRGLIDLMARSEGQKLEFWLMHLKYRTWVAHETVSSHLPCFTSSSSVISDSWQCRYERSSIDLSIHYFVLVCSSEVECLEPFWDYFPHSEHQIFHLSKWQTVWSYLEAISGVNVLWKRPFLALIRI